MVNPADLGAARRLLDASAVGELCASLPRLCGEDVQEAQLVTLWVKPGRHFNACYRVLSATQPSPRVVSICLVGADRATQLATAAPDCAAAVGAYLVQRFPEDYRLPSLGRCLDPAQLGAHAGAAAAPEQATPLSYRPGMRCQIRYEGRAGTWYGKVAAESVPGQAYAALSAVAAAADRRGGLRVARPLAYLADLHLTLIEALPGNSLYELLRARCDDDGDVVRAAAALERIHGLDAAVGERSYSGADEVKLTRGWVALVALLFPCLAPALAECHAALTAKVPAPPQSAVVVHRDFYDKQVLIAADGQAVLDFDTTCRGDREIDLGNFCAHLILRGLQWGLGDRPHRLAYLFLRGYPAAHDPVRVGWYRRAALLRLACYYALRPHWRHLAVPLLAEAATP